MKDQNKVWDDNLFFLIPLLRSFLWGYSAPTNTRCFITIFFLFTFGFFGFLVLWTVMFTGFFFIPMFPAKNESISPDKNVRKYLLMKFLIGRGGWGNKDKPAWSMPIFPLSMSVLPGTFSFMFTVPWPGTISVSFTISFTAIPAPW